MTPVLSDNAMRDLAQKYGLELRQNVFHSSDGYEFRQNTANGFECVGIIIGPVHSTIYRRTLPFHYVRWHERHWWLGKLFYKTLHSVEHIPVATISTVDLTTEMIDSAISQYIFSPKGSPPSLRT